MGDEVTREVLDRLIKIESRLELLVQEHPDCRAQVNQQGIVIAKLESSTGSAHKRIDDMENRVYKTVGIASTFVGIFASVLTWALSR